MQTVFNHLAEDLPWGRRENILLWERCTKTSIWTIYKSLSTAICWTTGTSTVPTTVREWKTGWLVSKICDWYWCCNTLRTTCYLKSKKSHFETYRSWKNKTEHCWPMIGHVPLISMFADGYHQSQRDSITASTDHTYIATALFAVLINDHNNLVEAENLIGKVLQTKE